MPRRLGIVVCLGVICTLVFAGGITAAASPQDVRDKRAEVSSAQERLQEMRREASAAYESYNNALFQLNELNGEIAAARKGLEAAERRLSEAEAELENSASRVYRSGNVAFVDVLVGVDSFTEFAARMDVWLRLLSREQDEVQTLQRARAELETRKAELEAQRDERVAALEEAAAQKERADAAWSEAQGYLDSLSGELRAAIEAEQNRQAELARQAAEKAARQAAEENVAREQAAQEALLAAQKRAEELAAQREAAEQAAREAELAAQREASAREAEERAEAAREAARRVEIEREAAELAVRQAAARNAGQRAAVAAAEEAGARQAAERQASSRDVLTRDTPEPSTESHSGDAAQRSSTTQGRSGAPSGGGNASDSSSGASGGSSGVSGSAVVAEARKYLGVPYVYGGASPSGFDCSGLVMYVFAKFGVSLPHSAAAQYGYGVSGSGAAGDLVFWAQGGGGITHNGIATGSGTVVHAPYPGTVVREEAIWSDGLVGYRALI